MAFILDGNSEIGVHERTMPYMLPDQTPRRRLLHPL